MPRIKIDNKEINAPEGVSVITAARMAGIDIPSMCYREGKEHFTSCMICMVKDRKNGRLFPSCSVKVTEDMDIISRDPEIEESRKVALELLLSDHVGDCEAPCQVTCPAHMDIPGMNRLLAEGKFDEALQIVKKDIAMPAVFGRICPAPCEGACRRKSIDSSVSICLLKRYAGDVDLNREKAWEPEKKKPSGKSVAIIGSGPAGLAASYFLGISGHQCTVFEKAEKAGGTLWTEVENGKLEEGILEKEIALCLAEAELETSTEINAVEFNKLQSKYDAVLLASGESSIADDWGLEKDKRGVITDMDSFRIGSTNLFAAGSVSRPAKLAIRTLGQGKDAAHSINLFLKGEEFVPSGISFNSRFGKLLGPELDEYMKESVPGERLVPEDQKKGLSEKQVMEEAARCLHCDCRDLQNCKLRLLSDEYKANQKRYWSENRKIVSKHVQHEFVIYEPAKCIKCGICVHITEEHRERFGLSFIGRGFDVVIGVPFGEALSKGLEEVSLEVVQSCPTGALSARETEK